MRKSLAKLSTLAAILVAIGIFAVPHATHAWSFIDIGVGTIQRLILAPLEFFTLPLAAGILALSGSIMDAAINFSLHTVYLVSLSPAINLGWSIVRDIANMFFIFIMLYIGIGTIVQGAKFQTKQLLTQIVIAALLINFSLFITKAVVDVSNIFGNWLYNGVQNTLNSNTTDNKGSLSALITVRLGIFDFWTTSAIKNANDTDKGVADNLTDPTKNFIGVFLRLSLVSIAIYIFAYCAILFIGRSVTLLFLMVFAPIGFMGGILPQIKSYSSKWRSELTNVCIFPIVFLLMLYISIQFINSLGFLSTTAINASKVELFGLQIPVAQYFQYFIIIFLLNSTLKVAKEYSGEIGKTFGSIAESLGKLAVNAVGTYATGGAALAMRAVGRGAGAALGAEKGKGWDEFKKTAKSNLPPLVTDMKLSKYIKDPSKIMGATANAMKSGTWDVRNLPLGGRTAGEIAESATGANLGSKDAKAIKADVAAWAEERKIEEAQTAIMAQLLAVETAKNKHGEGSPEHLKAIEDAKPFMTVAASKLSNKQLEKLDKAALKNKHFVQALSQSQVEHLAEKSEMSDDDKAKVWENRVEGVTTAVKKGGDVKKALKALSDKEVENLNFGSFSPAELSKLVDPESMGYDKFNNLVKNNKVPPSVKDAMKAARTKQIADAVAMPPGSARDAEIVKQMAKFKDANEVSKMDDAILKDNAVIDLLTTDVLNKMVTNDVGQATRDHIRSMLESHPGGTKNVDKMKSWLTSDRGDLF